MPVHPFWITPNKIAVHKHFSNPAKHGAEIGSKPPSEALLYLQELLEPKLDVTLSESRDYRVITLEDDEILVRTEPDDKSYLEVHFMGTEENMSLLRECAFAALDPAAHLVIAQHRSEHLEDK